MRRFLTSRGAVFAALRNFRRDHIDEERDWILRHKCKNDVSRCEWLVRQWATYEAEAEAGWERRTVAIEGSMLLHDARSPLAQAIFCNWFNEYITFSERDQIAVAYVLLRMGLTAEGGKTAKEVNLLGRSLHYLQSPAAKELELVKKVGHRSGSRKASPR